MKITKFRLGKTVATRAIMSIPKVSKEVPALLRRHRNCDHGEIPPYDKRQNDNALKTLSGRVLSSYNVEGFKVLIITDGFGTTNLNTTVLFPEDY